jgi:cell division septation protein DedD
VARKTPAVATVAARPASDAAPSAATMKAEPAHAAAARAPVVVPPPPKPVQVASIVPTPALTPPPKDLGPFTIQLGASQDRADAARLESRARSAGLAPYVVEADLGRKGLWYRVRVGSFSDKEAATRYRKDVERELGSRAVVMATR